MRSGSGRRGSRLLGVGGAQPTRVVTAAELGAPFGKSGEWVEARTGIRELRRLVADDPDKRDAELADLGVAAGEAALATGGRAGARADLPVDLIITASCSGDGSLGRSVAARLRRAAPWFEVNAACSGFCYALAAADAAIRAGDARHVLVVASEQMSSLVDPADLGTSIIFGDGAGAALVGPAEHAGIGPVVAGSDGAAHDLIACDGTGLMRMRGQQVFRWAVETVPRIATEACRRAGVRLDDIDVFVPHQANLRITEAVVRKLGLVRAVVAADVATSGNTSAASVPLALAQLRACGQARPGQLALLLGFGAGLTYAGQVVELPG